jgi:hypothetical protein
MGGFVQVGLWEVNVALSSDSGTDDGLLGSDPLPLPKPEEVGPTRIRQNLPYLIAKA